MAISTGSSALLSDIQALYNNIRTVLSRTSPGGASFGLSAPSNPSGQIKASDVNTLCDLFTSMKSNTYLKSDSSMYASYSKVTQGNQIKPSDITNVTTTVNNLVNRAQCPNNEKRVYASTTHQNGSTVYYKYAYRYAYSYAYKYVGNNNTYSYQRYCDNTTYYSYYANYRYCTESYYYSSYQRETVCNQRTNCYQQTAYAVSCYDTSVYAYATESKYTERYSSSYSYSESAYDYTRNHGNVYYYYVSGYTMDIANRNTN